MTAGTPPPVDVELELDVQLATRRAIRSGLVSAAHDCSEGGIAVALAESCIAGGTGGRFDLSALRHGNNDRVDQTLFGEAASRVLVQAKSGAEPSLESLFAEVGVPYLKLGETGGSTLALEGILDAPVSRFEQAWSGALEL